MRLLWTDEGWDDYLHWQTHNPKTLRAINDLIADVRRSPFQGLGKPEPLKYDLKGWWSRRITIEDRLAYRVVGKDDDQRLEIAQCRSQY